MGARPWVSLLTAKEDHSTGTRAISPLPHPRRESLLLLSESVCLSLLCGLGLGRGFGRGYWIQGPRNLHLQLHHLSSRRWGLCVSQPSSSSLRPDLLALLYSCQRKPDASVVGVNTTLMRYLCFHITSLGPLGGFCLARSCLCSRKD